MNSTQTPSPGRAATRFLGACAITLTVLLGAAPAGAVDVAGVKVPDTASVGGRTLPLNGAGIRSKFFIKVYVGALYLRDRTTDAEFAMQARGAKRIALHFLHKSVSRDKIRDAWEEGFTGNTPAGQRKALRADFDAFKNMWPEVKSGDVAHVDLIPGTGVQFTLNGKVVGTVANDALLQPVLAIWLGDKPADKSLRAGMLGG